MTKSEAEAICGTLSNPSKMPGYAYSTPAIKCITGSRLAKIPGTVCHGCYALKGRYLFGNVQRAMDKRFNSLTHPQWVEAVAFLIQSQDKCGYFRWHDSGDLQSVEHLGKICEVASRLPDIKFWLPTREKAIVRAFAGSIPANLTIRVSGTNVDGPAPNGFSTTSTVVTTGQSCPAPSQGNSCGPCRACWDPKVANVSYLRH